LFPPNARNQQFQLFAAKIFAARFIESFTARTRKGRQLQPSNLSRKLPD